VSINQTAIEALRVRLVDLAARMEQRADDGDNPSDCAALAAFAGELRLIARPGSGDFPDVPNWRDVRTGTNKAWAEFAEQHHVPFPAGSTPMRIRTAVRDWLEAHR
jgi:hypothetical protein